MEAPIYDVIVEADVGIPAIHELAEVRERETRHVQLGDEPLAVTLGGQLYRKLFHAHHIARRQLSQHGGVLLAILEPSHHRLRLLEADAACPRRQLALDSIL